MLREIVSKFAVELKLGYRAPNTHVYGLLNSKIDPQTREQEEQVWAHELWGIFTDRWQLGQEIHEDPGIRNAARYWFNNHSPEFLAEMHQEMVNNPGFLHIRGRDLVLWVFEPDRTIPGAYNDTVIMPSFSIEHDDTSGYAKVHLTQEAIRRSGQYLTVGNLLQAIILEKRGKGLLTEEAKKFSAGLEQRLRYDLKQEFAEIENPSQLIEELTR